MSRSEIKHGRSCDRCGLDVVLISRKIGKGPRKGTHILECPKCKRGYGEDTAALLREIGAPQLPIEGGNAGVLERFLDFHLRPAVQRNYDYLFGITIPELYATTAVDLAFQDYDPDTRTTTRREVCAGTTVRVVMASRLGDVGISTNLNKDNGYQLRVDPYGDKLKDFRERP